MYVSLFLSSSTFILKTLILDTWSGCCFLLYLYVLEISLYEYYKVSLYEYSFF